MKLSALASAPQLIKIEIAAEDIVEIYGEPLEYWTWDRYSADTYFRLTKINSADPNSIYEVVKDLVLDEEGNRILVGDITLPFDVTMRVLETAVNNLGNVKTSTGEQTLDK